MSLEQALADNTKALAALTAAITAAGLPVAGKTPALTAVEAEDALFGIASKESPDAAAAAAKAKTEAAAKAKADAAAKAKADAAAKAKAEAAAKAKADAEAAAASGEPEITFETLRERLRGLATSQGRPVLEALLQRLGVPTVPSIEPSQYGEVIKMIDIAESGVDLTADMQDTLDA